MIYKWNECLQFLCLTGALVLCYALGPEQVIGCLAIWGGQWITCLKQVKLLTRSIRIERKLSHETTAWTTAREDLE